MTLALVLLWVVAGISGLLSGGVGPARGAEAALDLFLAAALGPFTFLISYLALEMRPDEPPEDEASEPAPLTRPVRSQGPEQLHR